jgi:hypothetical protein
MAQPAVNNTEGQPVTDPFGQPGFPGFDGALANNTLGYVAQMQEAGVPVTFAYISDAHDNHELSRASGPGEADYTAQLKAYDNAFAAFFQRLAADGIDKSNTLFVATADEGDHFAGGVGTPQSDGSLGYSHTNCSWTTTPTCPSNQIGEVNLNIKPLLPAAERNFVVHNDSAPTFYVNGNPNRTDPTLRQLERDVAGLRAIDPYVSNTPDAVFLKMADRVGEKALHMVNSDPARTPNFTGFANPDYFITATTNQPPPTCSPSDGSCTPKCDSNPCIDYHFAWSHGDIQPEIASTWLGLVGPGVRHLGIESKTWTDHTNVRPTMLTLAGLKDDYAHDGRVLIEALGINATPQTLIAHRETLLRLGTVYEQLNASFGQFGIDLLTASTMAVSSTDESVYNSTEDAIASLTDQRDALAAKIKAALDAAAFDGQALNNEQARDWIAQAQSLIDRAHALTSP